MILKFFLALNILTAFQPFISQVSPITSSKPEIKSIYTDYPKDGIWVQIPKGTEKITFHVEAENTETILFWLIPTGTQTWTERKLIGYDIQENQIDNNFSLTWNIDKPYLHDHLYIQAIGKEIVTNDTINLYME
ncbi:hypothetical protein [Psychrobacillus vulpis]|uniref:hypothetical protein n=1 Tax=Psychrobacillus vulpis TaxID=2325572 RepID=UPI001F0EFA5F|nr:hypothetical protein [Psychrobacillus vulpis]